MTQSQQRYQEHLASEYWQTVSTAVKKRGGYRCQVCNSQHDLQAHHRTYEHRGSEMEYLDDLICLCRRCHMIFHQGGVTQAVPQVIERVIERVEVREKKPSPVTTHPSGLSKKQRRLQRQMERQKAQEEAPAEKYGGRVAVADISDATIDALMPPGNSETVVLTEELLSRCRLNQSFTTAATYALGVTDFSQGWPARLVGKEISRSQYRNALIGARLYSKEGAKHLAWRAALAPKP
jgi:hypothetical protein